MVRIELTDVRVRPGCLFHLATLQLGYIMSQAGREGKKKNWQV